MKYIITGLHSSGKLEAAQQLIVNGIRVGKMFTNVDSISYHKPLYEFFPTDEVNNIFENQAYVYFSEIENSISSNYEGLSIHEFDNNDVFVLSPNQLNSIPLKSLPSDICFIWMDCNINNRISRFKQEKRQYDFKKREELERLDLSDFVDKLYNMPNSRIVYFSNEDPQRVAALVEIMVKYPETIKTITKYFRD